MLATSEKRNNIGQGCYFSSRVANMHFYPEKMLVFFYYMESTIQCHFSLLCVMTLIGFHQGRELEHKVFLSLYRLHRLLAPGEHCKKIIDGVIFISWMINRNNTLQHHIRLYNIKYYVRYDKYYYFLVLSITQFIIVGNLEPVNVTKYGHDRGGNGPDAEKRSKILKTVIGKQVKHFNVCWSYTVIILEMPGTN
jgi:hypothetical protein